MGPVPYRLANGQREGRYLMFVKSGNVRVGLRPGCSGHGRIVLAATVCVFACFGCIEVWPPFAKVRTPLLMGTSIDLSIASLWLQPAGRQKLRAFLSGDREYR